jgi:hypothetical protein
MFDQASAVVSALFIMPVYAFGVRLGAGGSGRKSATEVGVRRMNRALYLCTAFMYCVFARSAAQRLAFPAITGSRILAGDEIR